MKPYRKRRRSRPDDLITASEIASYAFCPEAWRLEYGLGLPAENQAALGGRHAAPCAEAAAAARSPAGRWGWPGCCWCWRWRRCSVPGAFTMIAFTLAGPAGRQEPCCSGWCSCCWGEACASPRPGRQGRTVALDNVTLDSRRYGLTGRVDRLIRTGGTMIPEEWKSARVLRPWHRAQMGVYFLLIEDQLNVRPPHGFIVTGDGYASSRRE